MDSLKRVRGHGISALVWAALCLCSGCRADGETALGAEQTEATAATPAATAPVAAAAPPVASLERTIRLAYPNPRGDIYAEFYRGGQRVHFKMATTINGTYATIDFLPIIAEKDPQKIFNYASAKLKAIKELLGCFDEREKNARLSNENPDDDKIPSCDYQLNKGLVENYFKNRKWIPLRVGYLFDRRQRERWANAGALPEGVQKLTVPLRYYPAYTPDARYEQARVLAGHVLGTVKRDLWLDTPLGNAEKPDDAVPQIQGETGLEKSQNADLNGESRIVEYTFKFDENGKMQRYENEISAGVMGSHVVLGLDVQMQYEAEHILREHTHKSGTGKGAIVVLDADTMQIKALASWPNIDPNDFVPVLSTKAAQKYENNKANEPLIAKAFQKAYPPASVFKLATAFLALEGGLREDQAPFRCENEVTYHRNEKSNGITMRNWIQEPGKPLMTVTDAIRRSCNTWFFQAANAMEKDPQPEFRFSTLFEKFIPMLGLGKVTASSLPEEEAGKTLIKNGVREPFGEGAHVANLSIGQGELLVTPLQMAQMVARIARPEQGGMAHLVRALQQRGKNELREWDLIQEPSQKHDQLVKYNASLAAVRRGMFAVVNNEGGTGIPAQSPSTEYDIAGKTGTAERDSGRRNAEGKKVSWDVPWFAGYAPFDRRDNGEVSGRPAKYIVVAMQDGNIGPVLHGGNYAAPMVKEFFSSPYMQQRMEDHVYGRQERVLRAQPVDESELYPSRGHGKEPLRALPVEE